MEMETEKLQHFLADEKELLTDFLIDTENAVDNKEYARAAALWSMQSARVGAIKDVLNVLGINTGEDESE